MNVPGSAVDVRAGYYKDRRAFLAGAAPLKNAKYRVDRCVVTTTTDSSGEERRLVVEDSENKKTLTLAATNPDPLGSFDEWYSVLQPKVAMKSGKSAGSKFRF